MKKWYFLAFACILFSHCNEPEKPSPSPALSGNNKTGNTSLSGESGLSKKESKSSREKVPVEQGKNSIRHSKSITGKSSQIIPPSSGRSDSLVISRIRWLRNRQILIDINEPINRNFLLSPVGNSEFSSMIELSSDFILRINFDNDILNNTDQFYTNGLKFDLIAPFLQASPLSRLMIPYWRSGINYYGITLVQNMYTPSTTKIGGILYGDRPYAAYLLLGSYKISNDPEIKFRQTSELDLGVIGPYSFGEYVQKKFHESVPTNNEPLGWEYQIRNDFLINYDLGYEKGVISTHNFELNLTGAGALGTLYTNLEGGFFLRAGWFNPYFADLGTEKKAYNREHHRHNTQFYFYGHSTGRLVGYDATLQGGIFNRTSPYTINSQSISRFMAENSAGIAFATGAFRLEAEQYLLSPEFHHGWWHWWVHLCLTFSL